MSHDRDNTNIKHFKSRAQQPKILAESIPGIPISLTSQSSCISFDSDWNATSDQLDATRFRYIGTTIAPSMYGNSCARRMCHESMKY